MPLNDLCAKFNGIDSLNAAKMTKYSLVMTPTQCGVAGYIIYLLGVRIGTRALTYLLTYLHSWLRRMKLAISPKRLKIEAKVIINGLYKDGLSIAALMCALE